jgi:hypothetical protein
MRMTSRYHSALRLAHAISTSGWALSRRMIADTRVLSAHPYVADRCSRHHWDVRRSIHASAARLRWHVSVEHCLADEDHRLDRLVRRRLRKLPIELRVDISGTVNVSGLILQPPQIIGSGTFAPPESAGIRPRTALPGWLVGFRRYVWRIVEPHRRVAPVRLLMVTSASFGWRHLRCGEMREAPPASWYANRKPYKKRTGYPAGSSLHVPRRRSPYQNLTPHEARLQPVLVTGCLLQGIGPAGSYAVVNISLPRVAQFVPPYGAPMR